MRSNDPSRVGVLLNRTLAEPDHGFCLSLGVNTRRSQAVANALLMHQVGKEELWRLPQEVPSEMGVLRSAHYAAPTLRGNLDQIALCPTGVGPSNLGRPKIA